MSMKYNAEWIYTIGDCNQRCNQSYNAKNTSIDERVFKKGSVYMGQGKVVCSGS